LRQLARNSLEIQAPAARALRARFDTRDSFGIEKGMQSHVRIAPSNDPLGPSVDAMFGLEDSFPVGPLHPDTRSVLVTVTGGAFMSDSLLMQSVIVNDVDELLRIGLPRHASGTLAIEKPQSRIPDDDLDTGIFLIRNGAYVQIQRVQFDRRKVSPGGSDKDNLLMRGVPPGQYALCVAPRGDLPDLLHSTRRDPRCDHGEQTIGGMLRLELRR
jgi:hypothetical protein